MTVGVLTLATGCGGRQAARSSEETADGGRTYDASPGPDGSSNSPFSALASLTELSFDTELPELTSPDACEYQLSWDRDADGTVDGREVRRYDARGRLIVGQFDGTGNTRRRVQVEHDGAGNPLRARSRWSCTDSTTEIEDGIRGGVCPHAVMIGAESVQGTVSLFEPLAAGHSQVDVVSTHGRSPLFCDQLELDPGGKLISRRIQDPCEDTSAFMFVDVTVAASYDGTGRPLRYQLGNGKAADWTYDPEGRSHAVWDDELSELEFPSPVTSVKNRLVKAFDSAGRVIRIEFDEQNDGSIEQSADRQHDGSGRLLEERSDLDVDGITDLIRKNEYDTAGRLVRSELRNMTIPGDVWRFTGRFELTNAGEAIVISYRYDEQDRLVERAVELTYATQNGERLPGSTKVETREYGGDGRSVRRRRVVNPGPSLSGAPVEEIHCTWTSSCEVVFPDDPTVHCRYGELAQTLLPPYDDIEPKAHQGPPFPDRARSASPDQAPFVSSDLSDVVGYPWY